VSRGDDLPQESAEDYFEDAPCGCLSTTLDGTILRVNRTFETWTGLSRNELIGKRRFRDLLAGGSRIYHETHFAPLLQMQGEVREIAFELQLADGSRLPTLVNSVVVERPSGTPWVRTMIFDASDRRRYEQELLRARKREHEIAHQLQRSLLAGELPRAAGLEIAAGYRPAITGLEVGGDWYDAFWLDDRRVGLVVGDVVGRGVEAAATMGQLRSAVRAFASTGLRPAPLLEALDGYVRRHGVGATATVVYAELDLDSAELRSACAGHLPPLIAAEGEEPRLSWEGRSSPLDAHRGRTRGEAMSPLPPGSLVVLYTDGLVERRTQSIDEGIERLLGAVQSHRDEAPADLTTSLLRSLDDGDHRDDVCLLAASLAAAP
jgi:PAS domain S-box-containing protein